MSLPNPILVLVEEGKPEVGNTSLPLVPLVVLVVDDAASNRMLAAEGLKSAGHEVWEANDGQEALELLQLRAFDVVLSDLRMPHLDGVELLKHIRQQHSPEVLAVIFTSAYFAAGQCEHLLAMGANACLAKPYTAEALMIAIQGISQTAAAASAPVAGGDTLETIQSRWGDEKTSILLALYRTQVDEDVQRIRGGLEQRNEPIIRVAAHRIVSASRALGLHANAEAALQIETCGENQAVMEWESVYQTIHHHLGLIKV